MSDKWGGGGGVLKNFLNSSRILQTEFCVFWALLLGNIIQIIIIEIDVRKTAVLVLCVCVIR